MKTLKESYSKLIRDYDLKILQAGVNINFIIRESLNLFTKQCQNAAIWCYGTHTKMLMADFMNELRQVKFIIDNSYKNSDDGGFEFISEDEIREKQIDGIIISTYKFRREIIEGIQKKFPDIQYLDFYSVLNDEGIHLYGEYYAQNHPYYRYQKINEIQRELLAELPNRELEHNYWRLIEEYIAIKDFRTAIIYAEELCGLYQSKKYKGLLKDLRDIYELEKEVVDSISEDNVIMLCFDGLRRRDIQDQLMPQISRFVNTKACSYNHAYSVSTSTYESLIPAYSQNNDLRTRNYECIQIPEAHCRFICEARKQGRNIYFYTDSDKYIESDVIIRNESFQTATEKLWEFIVDASGEKNGLFYLHILYESHFSYGNPYTKEKLIADGSHIFFDFLKRSGGKLRTDYNRQHQDALRYLDDVFSPFLELLKCRMVIYADHGNIILDSDMSMDRLEKTKYTFHGDLVQIPLIIKSPEIGIGKNYGLISLMSFNDIVISLMKKDKYVAKEERFIKVQRSALYNPDFRFLYKKNGQEHSLLAFEAFIFEDGYKLVVFEDGVVELFLLDDDREIYDLELKKQLFYIIVNSITVCKVENVKV